MEQQAGPPSGTPAGPPLAAVRTGDADLARALLDLSPISVAIIESESSRFLWTNTRLREMLGGRTGQVPTHGRTTFVDPAQRAEMLARYRAEGRQDVLGAHELRSGEHSWETPAITRFPEEWSRLVPQSLRF